MNSEEQTEQSGQYIRTVFKTPEFEAFYNALPEKTQAKFDYVMNVITTIYNLKSFKLFLRKEFETVFERILPEIEGAMRAS